MSRLSSPILRVLLYEGPGSSPLSDQFRGALLQSLLERGFPVSCMRSGTIDALRNSVLLMGKFDSHPQAASSQVRFQRLKGPDPAQAADYADQVRNELG